jgi:GntR family transcriptional regulator of arabinose operon
LKKYLQLYNLLREKIIAGDFAISSKLPTENALASSYGVSRQTVRQSLEMLKNDGFIYSVQGSGYFVCGAEKKTPPNRRIAVITTYISEYIFPSILRGIDEVVSQNEYTIEFSSTNNSISAEKSILKKIIENPVAGIIVEGTKSALPNPNIAYYQQLEKQGIPIVFINSIYPGLESDRIIYVVTDDFNGGYKLTQDLISKQHRRIGGVFKSDDLQGINRYSGAMSALVNHNVEYEDKYFMLFSTETRQYILAALIPSGIFNNCSALICYNDQVVCTICNYLRQNKHSIRTIVSFDRDCIADLVPPEIEYFSLPHPRKLLGEIAAKKLFNMLAGESETSVVLPWEESN